MRTRSPDHYDRLGVERTASLRELRAAYRAAARRAHPDIHPDIHPGGPDGDMAAINEAWFALRDRARRAAYDRWLGPPEPATEPDGEQPVAPSTWHADPGGTNTPEIARFRRLLVATILLSTVVAVVMTLIAFAQSG